MKKKLVVFLFLICSIFLSGCGKHTDSDIIKDFKKRINDSSAYHITGNLSMIMGEEEYKYNVEVSYKKKDNFRVRLINKVNNHEQIILKNDEGVYVLTPSIKKSFKFQSEWPYNNSQSYIMQSLVSDIESDKDTKLKRIKNEYVIETKANYSNNKELIRQRIYLDKKLNIKKVEVLNKEGKPFITMIYKNIDMNPTFNHNYFDLKTNLASKIKENTKTVSKINDVLYPMYMPTNTSLEKQEKVDKTNGERVIMTFAGDKSFTLVQETMEKSDDNEVIPMYGEPEIMPDTVAAVGDSSITWNTNGIDYYIASNNMDSSELLSVAKSINTLPIGK